MGLLGTPTQTLLDSGVNDPPKKPGNMEIDDVYGLSQVKINYPQTDQQFQE